jgi:exopolysaccharide biosynthesis protein
LSVSKTPLRLLSLLAATASTVALAVPAGADPNAATSDAAAYPGDDFLSTARVAATAEQPPRIETAERSRPVAPGVTLRSFDRYGPDAFTGTPTWLQADSLSVDLTKGTTVDYLFPGQVAKGEPLTATANRAGAVAAVNGDFFDINNSTAPLGVGIQDGAVIQSPDVEGTWRQSSAILTEDGAGDIGEVFFQGTVKTPVGDHALDGVNKPTLKANGIEAFTPLWGDYCRCRATQGATAVTEVEVANNTVTAVRDTAGQGAIPDGTMMLVGRDDAATRLRALKPGDTVSVDYQARTAEDQKIHAAINGRQLLVVDGVVQKASQGNNVPAAPRTAIGFSQDGKRMFLLTADGRQPAFAEGLGLDELANMMVELGAYSALNLDGGGSTTLISGGRLRNRPREEHGIELAGGRPITTAIVFE